MTKKESSRWRTTALAAVGAILVIAAGVLNPGVMLATALVLSGLHHFRRGVSPPPTRGELLRTSLAAGAIMWTVLVVGEMLIDWMTREPELIIEGQALAGEAGGRALASSQFFAPGMIATIGTALFLYGVTRKPRRRRRKRRSRKSGAESETLATGMESDAA